MGRILGVIMVAVAALLLYGCFGLGGGGATPTPSPHMTPGTTETPAVTPTANATAETTETPAETPTVEETETPAETPPASPTETPGELPTPTPAGGNATWENVFGCAQAGLSYTYRVITENTTLVLQYTTGEGGTVEGVDTVLRTATMNTSGTTVTAREWDAKVGCRCVKAESVFSGQTIPGQCPAAGQGTGEPIGSQTTITTVGVEQVSVPAYTGPATKIRVVSTSASGTYTADVWQVATIAVPVKMVASNTTTELVSYTG